ncbi:Hypothetical protein DHA2_16670 [Giardia duodenalis]|uniref:Uncharacterized protein n=1 Tax=Giardia intestinalis TaxID=5741 RepID=V6TFN5_GIAIN|nr:Hypothetical protein DHA2_16670 [Giardia intestinalis]
MPKDGHAESVKDGSVQYISAFDDAAKQISIDVLTKATRQVESNDHEVLLSMARNAERRRLDSPNNVPFIAMVMLILTLFSIAFYQIVSMDANSTRYM